MKKVIVSIILFALLLLALPTIYAYNESFVFVPDANTGIDALIETKDNADGNYGTYEWMNLGYDLGKFRMLLNFSGVCNGSFIGMEFIDVQFQVWIHADQFDTIEEPYTVMYPVSAGWSESTVTWNNFGSSPGGVNNTDFDGTQDIILSPKPNLPDGNGKGYFNFSLDPDYFNDFCSGTHSSPNGVIWLNAYVENNEVASIEYFDSSDSADGSQIWRLWYTLEQAPDTTPPTITLNYPVSDSYIDGEKYPFYINGTASDDIGVVNVSQNNSLWGDNIGTNESWSFLNTSEIPEGNYTINITAYDDAGNFISFFANFTVDFTLPILTRNLPTTLSSQNQTGVPVNVSATDNYLLYSYNLTCRNMSDDIMFSHQETSINNNYYSHYDFLNWTGYPPDTTYECTTEVYDTHTSNVIDDMGIIKHEVDQKLTYNTNGGTDISIKLRYSDIPLNDFGTSKYTDRYKFDYDFGKGADYEYTYIFVLSSTTDEVVYIPNSIYKGHFIVGRYWVTFDINSKHTARYEVTKSGKNYEITIITKETHLDFNSIGELNYANLNFTITKNALPVINLSLVSPANDSTISCGSGLSFDYYINATNTYLSLYFNYTLNKSMTASAGSNSFAVNISTNETLVWSVNSTNSTIGTTPVWMFTVDCTEIIIPPANITDGGSLGFNTCHFSTTNYGMIFGLMFMFVLSAGAIAGAYIMRNAILGFIGALMLLFSSLYLYNCFALIGFSVSVISLWLGWYFISNGWLGRL